MQCSHIHLMFRDYQNACAVFRKIFRQKPSFSNERMSVYKIGVLELIIDSSRNDSSAILGFEVKNCRREYARLKRMGLVPIEPPSEKPWGVRNAYLKGPGKVIVEVEEMIK